MSNFTDGTEVERELKLVPEDPALLDGLANLTTFGELAVTGRRHELQHNAFFDTPTWTLTSAHVGFRRRALEGQAMATWSLKAHAATLRGVVSRTEIELQLDPDLAPALALDALRQAARGRGAATLAETVEDALSGSGLPLAKPFLETRTDRAILDLAASARGWAVELALDRMRIVGHAYAEIEIEAELKRGDEEALEMVRAAIEARGGVEESAGTKLSRAIAHIRGCACPTS